MQYLLAIYGDEKAVEAIPEDQNGRVHGGMVQVR